MEEKVNIRLILIPTIKISFNFWEKSSSGPKISIDHNDNRIRCTKPQWDVILGSIPCNLGLIPTP